MKADVSYNDFIGTVAADISDAPAILSLPVKTINKKRKAVLGFQLSTASEV